MFAPFCKEGIGLHSGSQARILVEMGLPGTGVVFLAGVFWAAMRIRSGSLYGSIVSHFLADAAIMIIYVAFIQQHL